MNIRPGRLPVGSFAEIGVLGFTTNDLPALLKRVQARGGSVLAPMNEMPDLKIRVAFATDPEGHLAELVQVVE